MIKINLINKEINYYIIIISSIKLSNNNNISKLIDKLYKKLNL